MNCNVGAIQQQHLLCCLIGRMKHRHNKVLRWLFSCSFWTKIEVQKHIGFLQCVHDVVLEGLTWALSEHLYKVEYGALVEDFESWWKVFDVQCHLVLYDFTHICRALSER